MTKAREVVRIFIDDGFPESSDYDSSYTVISRRPRGGFLRAVRVRLQRTLRRAWRTLR